MYYFKLSFNNLCLNQLYLLVSSFSHEQLGSRSGVVAVRKAPGAGDRHAQAELAEGLPIYVSAACDFLFICTAGFRFAGLRVERSWVKAVPTTMFASRSRYVQTLSVAAYFVNL